MSLRINQNIDAVNSYRNLSVTQGQMSKSLEKLSSGFRINRAADDAAGLAISEGLRSQVGGLKVAVRNAQDGISVVQTAEGALTEVHSLLQRVRDLAVQSANTGGNSPEAREAAAVEVQQALDEIDRIATATKYGGSTLLDGSSTGLVFHVGSGSGAENQVSVNVGDMQTSALGFQGNGTTSGTSTVATGNVDASAVTDYSVTSATFSVNGATVLLDADYTDAAGKLAAINTQLAAGDAGVTASYDGSNNLVFTADTAGSTETITLAGADAATVVGTLTTVDGTDGTLVSQISAGNANAIDRIDDAIATVSTQRANLGAYQNRLEHTIANLSVTIENLTASESRIRDTDMAAEMVSFTRSQILTQAGTAMLAQANQLPQSVLQLLR
jgi:flagellin